MSVPAESSFLRLVHNFNKRVAIIAFICILLAGIIAVPIARFITRPIDQLVKANRRLADGDMTVRVEAPGEGELAMLTRSFNTMVRTPVPDAAGAPAQGEPGLSRPACRRCGP